MNITTNCRLFSASLRLVVGLFFFAIGGVLTAQTEESADGFTINFSDPPYKLGESVLDIDGWYAVGPLKMSENEEIRWRRTPVAVQSPSDGSKMALVIPSHGIIKNCQEPLIGRVRITAVLQVGTLSSGSFTLSPLFGKRAIINFGFASKNGPQFYYEIPGQPALGLEGTAPVTLVEQEDIVTLDPYTLVLEVDMDAFTFDVSVTSENSGGSPINVAIKDIPLPLTESQLDRNVSAVRLVGSDNVENPAIFLESLEVRLAQ